MPRGKAAKIGDTYVSANGYHHTRTASGWILTHRKIAQDRLGRALSKDEYVAFADGNRENLDPKNIVIRQRNSDKGKSIRSRIRQKKARIEELQEEVKFLEEELDAYDKKVQK